MNIAAIFIKRPVMTTLIMLAIMLFGVMGYRQLPVNDLPNVDYPFIVVSASLPGASPETMASAVATPLEKQFSTINGIDTMTSSNSLGSTQITLMFNLSRSIDAAAQDVQTAIAQTLGQLPQDMPSPPTYKKTNPADQPILYLALSSSVLPLSTVDEFAETNIAQRVSMITGVAQVQVFGAQKYAVRARLNPHAMATRGVGIDEVVSAISNGNVELPTGTLDGRHQSFTVQANGQLEDAKAYEPLIVAYRNGSPVRLKELGKVVDSVENDQTASWFGTSQFFNRAIVLAIQRQPGTNTVEVVDAIKKLLPAFRVQMPAAVELNILFDRTESIRASVNDVKFTLVLTICLVIMVIFLFLRSMSATIIPSLALPLSLVATFAVMYVMDFSLDNLSLMALTLSVGFVVDDAIVMLENIVRHKEQGESVMDAAFNGSREVGFTILSMTISLAAVFIPVLFMGGLIGRLMHEFAVTITVAILVSGFVSLSLTPMLCSRFLRPHGTERHGHLFTLFEKFFDGMRWGYEVTLRRVMLHRVLTMLVAVASMVATVYLFQIIPKGFIPTEDTGRISVQTEAAQGSSFENMVKHQQAAAAIIRQEPNVEAFMSSVANGNSGRMFLRLKPRSERQESVDEIIQQLRPKFAKIPGLRVYLQNPLPISTGGQQTRSLYQFTLQSVDTKELYRYAPILEGKIRELPGLQDVTSDLLIKNPHVNVNFDRDKASALGITARQIEDALGTAYGQRQVSTILTPNNQYHVITELETEYQLDPSVLSMLYIRSSKGQLVPLNAIATLSRGVGPLTVNHLGQLPAVTISFNLKPGMALGTAVDDVNKVARGVLPATISAGFQGTAQAFQASNQTTLMLLFMAIVVIYIVLGILYESFIHPLTILSGLPTAGVGALLTLKLFHQELNLYSYVGIIMLIGIVKKNAIMMIDFALEAQRKEGKTPAEAIVEGCLVRFRPIMMTTMAALMGGLPIALGFGAGAEARRPLGLCIVGGLIFSQALTLYITPVFYTYMENLRGWGSRHFGRRRSSEGEPEPETSPRPRQEAALSDAAE